MLRVILVDDEEMALDVLEILLLEIGQVEIVAKFQNAMQALTYIEQQTVDMVFLDIEMPGMNGLSAAEHFVSSHPAIEVVYVTAYDQYAIQAFEQNALDYLLKPVDKARLEQIHHRFLRRLRLESTQRHTPPPLPERLMAQIPIKVMGGLEMYDASGELVRWRTKKAKELFAMLYHTAGNAVHRDKILEELWPDISLDRAQTLLHTTLYQIRSKFKEMGLTEVIRFADERYMLQDEYFTSDREQLLQHLGAQQTPIAILLSMYSGDYLAVDGYVWAESERIRLRRAYTAKLEASAPICALDLQADIYMKLLELDMYHEPYYQQLMTIYGRMGDFVSLQRIYHKFEQLWELELGIEVSKEIRHLYHRYQKVNCR